MTVSFIYTIAIVLVVLVLSDNLEDAFLKLFTVLAAFEVNLISSSALMIGSQEIQCTDILLTALFVCSILLLCRGMRIKRSLFICGVIVLFIAFVSLAYNLCFPYQGYTIPSSGSWDAYVRGRESLRKAPIYGKSYLSLIRLLIYITILWCAGSVIRSRNFTKIVSGVLVFGKAQILFGMFEFVTKVLFKSAVATSISLAIFPAFSSYYEGLNMRGNISALQGFTREPSNFARALTFILVIFIVTTARGIGRKHDAYWCVAAIFLLLVSGAFSAIYGMGVIAVVWLFYFGKRSNVSHHKHALVSLGIVVVVILGCAAMAGLIADRNSSIYYVVKLQNVLDNFDVILNRNYGSLIGEESFDAIPRMASIVECIQIFLSNPIFGIGPGTVNPFSGVVAMLSQYGILFVAAWLTLMKRYCDSFAPNANGMFFVVFILLFGLLQCGGGYEYVFAWLFFGGLFQMPIGVRDQPSSEAAIHLRIFSHSSAGLSTRYQLRQTLAGIPLVTGSRRRRTS